MALSRIDRVEDVSMQSLRKIVTHVARGASAEEIAAIRGISMPVAQALCDEIQWVRRSARELGLTWRYNEAWVQFRERVFQQAKDPRPPLPIQRPKLPKRAKWPNVPSPRDLEIYRARQKGATLAAIGERYGLSKQRVQKIVQAVEQAPSAPAEDDQKKAR